MKRLSAAVLCLLLAPASALGFSERFRGNGDEKIKVDFQVKNGEVRDFRARDVEFTCDGGDAIREQPDAFNRSDVSSSGRFDDKYSSSLKDDESGERPKLKAELDGRLSDEKKVKGEDKDAFQKGRGTVEYRLEFDNGDECETGELDWKADT